MNGAPTSSTQIKEAELNVHKETSQLYLHFHCERAAINHKPVFNVGHQRFQFVPRVSHRQLVINDPRI